MTAGTGKCQLELKLPKGSSAQDNYNKTTYAQQHLISFFNFFTLSQCLNYHYHYTRHAPLCKPPFSIDKHYADIHDTHIHIHTHKTLAVSCTNKTRELTKHVYSRYTTSWTCITECTRNCSLYRLSRGGKLRRRSLLEETLPQLWRGKITIYWLFITFKLLSYWETRFNPTVYDKHGTAERGNRSTLQHACEL